MRDHEFGQPVLTRSQLPGRALADLGGLHTPVGPRERSCCCPAWPHVRVVLPATSQRDHAVDLLLCAHHLRMSRTTIADAGGHVFDSAGALLLPGS